MTARKPPTALTFVGGPGSVNGEARVVAGADSPTTLTAATRNRYSRPLASCCTVACEAADTPSSTTVQLAPSFTENETE